MTDFILDIDSKTGCLGGEKVVKDLDDIKWCFHKRGDIHQDASKNKCTICKKNTRLFHQFHSDIVFCQNCFRIGGNSIISVIPIQSGLYTKSPPINIRSTY